MRHPLARPQHRKGLNGLHCVEFLLHLLHVAGERLRLIWDGSPIHRRVEVNEFVASTRGRVWLEALPGYAPDLNPCDEGGWHHLKDVELRNLVCRELDELHQELYLAVRRLTVCVGTNSCVLRSDDTEAVWGVREEFHSVVGSWIFAPIIG